MPTILFEDSLLIAINKPAGMPAQADKTGDRPALQWAGEACGQDLHPVHRLDRPASGVLLLAKTKAAMAQLQRQFQAHAVEKEYLAVVSAPPPEAEGTLVHYLQKNAAKNRAFAAGAPAPDTERAELHYRLLGSSQRYHLVHIRLVTGRHHQIRAQLAAIGCPIKGDVKYGARRGNRDRSIHLHAWRLAFEHPGSGEWIELQAPLPEGDPVWEAMRSLLEPLA
ncbi:MAG: RluA family pseudouridine synthase [Saprospirales bacterium]|nr:RluA family pseudouridine synthase [Saprospirales bacterium]MBK8921809.1 RluA family pseudouridine synthase [Saprospirales bacterium]